jgi:hypothetical protein
MILRGRRIGIALRVAAYGCVLAALATAKRLLPLRLLVRWAWRPPILSVRNRAAEQEAVSRVLQANRLIGAPDRDCLQRSLLLYRVLSTAGADPELHVGFRRDGPLMAGHAWVVCDGRVVAEPAAGTSSLVPALRFGRAGAILTEPPPAQPSPRIRVA